MESRNRAQRGALVSLGRSSASPTMEPRHITAIEIERWLIAKISSLAHLQPEEIDSQEVFSYYGLDSIAAVSLSADLEDWLGCRLPPTLAFDYPTVEALVTHLAQRPNLRW